MSKANYYAVARGRQPGIYTRWQGPGGAEEQVKGYAGAAYQGFRTRAEAEAWLQAFVEPQQPAEAEPPAPAATIDPRQALATGHVVIYTDGGCIGNPGPGGYGVVLLCGKHRRELSAGYRLTTNNRMELMACIAGLRSLKRQSAVVLYSDSRYVVNGITRGWARGWRDKGWRRSGGVAENADLWSELLDLCDQHQVEFVWVRGHVGNRENERCDRLAMAAAGGRELAEDTGFRQGQASGEPGAGKAGDPDGELNGGSARQK